MKNARAVIVLLSWFGFSLLQGAPVEGRVYLDPRRAASSVELLILNIDTTDGFRVFTDQRGHFSIDLPAGDYAIYSRLSGIRILLTTLRVEEDETRHVELQLSPSYPTTEETSDLETTSVEAGDSTDLEGQGEKQPPGFRNIDEADEHLSSLEEIRELQIQSSTPAEPRSSLAEIVNPFPARKKARWHGSLYEFHRNDNFDARNFFDPVGERLPEYKRNQFGFSVGTTLRDGLNLLGSYEGLRIIRGSTLLSHVPTASMKRGDFSHRADGILDPMTGDVFLNNLIPQERIHPVSSRMLNLLPDPNRADPDRNFVNNQPFVQDTDSLALRLDHQVSPSSKIFFRYSFNDREQARVHPLPSFGSDRRDQNHSGFFTYTRSLSSRLIASAELRLNRQVSNTLSKNAGREGVLNSLGISGLGPVDPSEEGYPEFSLAGYADFGDRSTPVTAVYNDLSLEGSASYAVRDHTFRFGVEFDSHQVNDYRPGSGLRGRFSFNGHYTGDAFADFLLGVPDAAYRVIGSDRSDLRAQSWEFYLRHEWRMSPQLNFNLGLTYNYYQPYRSVHNNVSTFYPLLLEPPLDGEIVIAGSDRARELGLSRAGDKGLVFPDLNDWAPRLGLGYNPFGNRHLVLQGSYSIFHFSPERGDFLQHLGRNYPFYYTESAQSPVDRAELDLAFPFETSAPTELRVRSIEPRLRTPYEQTWRMGVQSEIIGRWVWEASYGGQKTTHSRRVLTGNVPLPGPGSIQPRRPNPNFADLRILTGSGSWTRNSLGLSLDRRFSDGLALKSGFTWSRAFSDGYGGYPSNPRNIRAERAPVSNSPVRRFFLSYIYDLPLGPSGTEGPQRVSDWLFSGWRLSGVTSIQDGNLFSVTLPGDPNNDGVPEDRPDRLGPGSLDTSQQSIDEWFVAGDFAEPAPYSFGNAGRNILAGPGFHNWDLSVVKQTRFPNGDMVELRIELFNAFNQVNLEEPDAVFGTSPFGKIFGAKRSREIEIALKYSF